MRLEDIAFPVGEYVREELTARGWTTLDAIKRLDGFPAHNELWLELVCCVPAWYKHNILFKPDEAERLAQIFGTSAELWIKLDASFRATKEWFNEMQQNP
jgi:hypothetical protein